MASAPMATAPTATAPIANAPMAKLPNANVPTAAAPTDAAGCFAFFWSFLEREPVAAVGIDLILRVDARAQADAGAHRCQGDTAAALIIDAKAGDEIDAAFHAGEALKQALLFPEV